MDRFMLWMSIRNKRVDGLWVGVWDETVDTELVWGRVEGALSLIKTYDRVRYGRLIRDVERVWVCLIPSGGVAAYNGSIRTCQLDTRFVLSETSTPEVVASAIVHEATHARLRRCGIGYEEGVRARVEAVCFRREIAFTAKLPNGQEARDLAERYLEFYAADEHWTDAAVSERYVEDGMSTMRYIGIPEWLVWLLPTILTLRRRVRALTRSGRQHTR
jgi:hypothetical protein